MKRFLVLVFILSILITVEALAEDIGSIIPDESIWGISVDELKEAYTADYIQCQVEKDEAWRVSNVEVCSYDMDVYYVFEGTTNAQLSKIAYILNVSDFDTDTELDECLQVLVNEMKRIAGEPDSVKKNTTIWKTEQYKIEIGKGKLSKYTGSDKATVALIFKKGNVKEPSKTPEPTKEAASSNNNTSGMATAEGQTAEESAKAIFSELSYIYDASLYFLEERQSTWSALLTVDYKDVNHWWFYENIAQILNQSRFARIITTALTYGYDLDEIRNSEDLYNNLFMPIYERMGRTEDGFKKACFAYSIWAFWDSSIPDRLEQQKQAIFDLMDQSPDYANLEGLKDFFKKTSLVVDYTQGSDTYINTAQKISEFQNTRLELKNAFVFDFDWPDFSTPAVTEDTAFSTLFTQYKEKQRIKEEKASKLKVISKHFMTYAYSEVADVRNLPEDWTVNQPDYTIHYSYNDSGFLVQASKESENGSDYPSVEKYDVDSEGHIVSGVKSGTWFADKGCTYDSITTYDDHNNLIREEKTYHSPQNKTYKDGETHVYEREYTYDDMGNILTDVGYTDGEKDKYGNHTYSYTYDEDNRIMLIEDEYYTDSYKIHYMEYDDVGLLVRELIEPKKKEEGKMMTYTIIEYTYPNVEDP